MLVPFNLVLYQDSSIHYVSSDYDKLIHEYMHTQFISRIMGHHFNFNPHIILPKPCYTNTRPDVLMIRHIALEVGHHCLEGLVIDRDMVRVHPEDLLPALAASVLQVQFDVCKSLVDLCVDFSMEYSSLGVPAACGYVNGAHC